MKRALLAITLSYASSGTLYAQNTYVAPQAVKIMFHVDKLPIDQGIRQQLSKNLTVLAMRAHNGSAAEHRLTAQLLMLAMRLNRENTAAFDLNENLSKGGSLPVSHEKAKEKALNRVSHAIGILSNTDKNSEARVLEVYLKDVLTALDKNGSLATNHEENKLRWEGIVPVINEKTTKLDLPKPKPTPDPSNEDKIANRPDIDVPDSTVNDGGESNSNHDKRPKLVKWKKQNSNIMTPLTLFTVEEERVRNTYELVTMNTEITPLGAMESNFRLELKPWADPEKIETFMERIDRFLKSEYDQFESLKVEITTSGRLSEKSRSSILLPLSLQLRASERDIKIRGGICVLGKLSGNNIIRDSGFWQTLKLLRKRDARNQRLLVPSNAEADLRQLLALEEEDFFLRNEVLLVSNIEEAADFLGQSRKSAINEAAAEFAKIQEMIGTKSMGPYSVNKKVRAKLVEILAKNPNHLSAKMILLRGNASRSRKLESYFIADELSTILKKASYLNSRDEDSIYGNHVFKLALGVETSVKKLDPLLDIGDRKLTSPFGELKSCLETLARAAEKYDKRESTATKKAVTTALDDFKLKYKEIEAQLDVVMSQPPKSE